jgi:hypothetical protein
LLAERRRAKGWAWDRCARIFDLLAEYAAALIAMDDNEAFHLGLLLNISSGR